MTLVDTNVLLDVATGDPNWGDWSIAQLEAASIAGPLFINDVIYAELSVRYDSMENLEIFLKQISIEMAAIPKAALFLAGKVFAQYRRSNGKRTGVLPDFFIGSHAAVSRLPLLTRDLGRYRIYFPSLALITPQ